MMTPSILQKKLLQLCAIPGIKRELSPSFLAKLAALSKSTVVHKSLLREVLGDFQTEVHERVLPNISKDSEKLAAELSTELPLFLAHLDETDRKVKVLKKKADELKKSITQHEAKIQELGKKINATANEG